MKFKAVDPDPVTAGVMEVKDGLTAGITAYLGAGSSMADRREYLIFLAGSVTVSLGIFSRVEYTYLRPWLRNNHPKRMPFDFQSRRAWV